jgi:Uma2 family endonuclease
MVEPARRVSMSFADYVAAEAKSEIKHEWLNGEVRAMSGGTPEHSALAMALGRQLGNALEGRPCRVFSSDLRIRVLETGLSTYPDLSVVCGKLEVDAEDANSVVNPVLLVEVLSDTTEGYDRGEKFAHYRRIASLQELVLVSQHEPRIEVYTRTDDGAWKLREWRSGGRVELTSLAVSLAVDDVYRDPLAGSA